MLGPAEDGGYVLIGMRRTTLSDTATRAIFEHIAWGTQNVLRQTRARLRAHGIPWRELTTLWDVDRPPDLARLRATGFSISGLA
ncbi:MAG: TIGR04282 family arsenosugar biosynthesis glycosyltransferase [Gammaproteobacteria bacterium]